MPTLFDVDHAVAGFRLQFVEIYNWGTFDEKIWRLSPGGKHSLLTGSNGSGKTTLVDALLTLLVPSSKRFYNQSSGAENRRERNEKSYCLGAYGNIQYDHKSAVTTQYLRTKDDYSILLGCFRDRGLNQDVTLAQVRWFSNNELKRVYMCAPHELTIQEHFTPLDPAGEWKRRLRGIERMELFDSFNHYSQKFSRVFGFKSAKALNLFAHTVGIKVLGNLNEFIRTNMLEETDIEEDFKKLREHYNNLLSVHNTIEKAKEQLIFLEPIIEQGQKYQSFATTLRDVEETLEIVPAYFAREKLGLLGHAIGVKEQELESIERSIEDIRSDLAGLESQKTEIEIAMSRDETGEQIRNIDRKINALAKERNAKQHKAREYDAIAEMLHYPMNPDEQGFYETLRKAQEQKQQIEQTLPELHETWSDARNVLQSHQAESRKLLDEVRSLEGRKNQIPLKNISIRKGILQHSGASEAEMPFVGELIQVKHRETLWESAIERLLHNFGLILLVPGKYYRQVNRYVNSTDLMGRLVYFKVDPRQIELPEDEEHPDSLITKLAINPKSAYHDWVRFQLRKTYDYICVKNIDDFQRYEKALTQEGLTKTNERHEKDDRMQVVRQGNYILGWDNSGKIEIIQAQRRELEKQIQTVTGRIKRIEREREDLTGTRDRLNTLLNFKDYHEIDWQKHVLKIQQFADEQQRLKESSDQLRELEQQFQQVKEQILNRKKLEDQLAEQRANLRRDIQEYQKRRSENTSLLEAYQHIALNEYVQRLEPYLKRQDSPLTLETIDSVTVHIRDSVYRKLKQKRQEQSKIEIALVRKMHLFKTPQEEITHKYPSWVADTADLQDSPEFINEYITLYTRIKDEDLPRHEERFKTWLNERVIVNFASFEASLDRQFKGIKASIKELNESLQQIEFHSTPPTYIQLDYKDIRDRGETGINMFRQALRDVFSNISRIHAHEELENCFSKVKSIIERLTNDEAWRRKVTDVRNWLEFGAIEKHRLDESPKQYYDDSQGLSGGEKAKLAYTILASAIAYQFGIHRKSYQMKSFRFVVVDEAFSKVDPENALFAMELFQQLNLQLMVVTPLDKINIAERFIHSVHYTENKNRRNSAVYDLTIEEYQAKKEALKAV